MRGEAANKQTNKQTNKQRAVSEQQVKLVKVRSADRTQLL